MFAHSLDLVMNAWLEYRKNAEFLDIEKKKVMDLLLFRHEVVEPLILSGKPVPTRKRGRPSLQDEDTGTSQKSKYEI